MELKEIKSDYDKLKSEGKLSLRSSNTNILDNPLIKQISESWKQHVNTQGISSIPFDMVGIINDSGVSMDFDHAKDKCLRAFEIVALSHVSPEDMTGIKGFYGKETTAILRKHITRGKHIIVESNKSLGKCFVSVDLSTLLAAE